MWPAARKFAMRWNPAEASSLHGLDPRAAFGAQSVGPHRLFRVRAAACGTPATGGGRGSGARFHPDRSGSDRVGDRAGCAMRIDFERTPDERVQVRLPRPELRTYRRVVPRNLGGMAGTGSGG